METIYSWTLAVLERHGWWQNPDVGGSQGKNESGSRCVVQALVDAANEMSRAIPSATGRHHVALALITEGEIGLMRKLGAKTLSDVFHWNDAPERTFEDVRDLLMELHNNSIKAMEIGEPQKEVEFVPLETPAEVPVAPAPTEPVTTPVENPVEEPAPA